nr:MAG TPA: hypothetical protein [Caudoviricetes sp.]
MAATLKWVAANSLLLPFILLLFIKFNTKFSEITSLSETIKMIKPLV